MALRDSFSPLLIGAASLMFAGGLNGLILPVRGAIEGFSPLTLGLLGTGWAIGFIAGCLLVPRVVRRVGHIRAFGAMTSFAAVSILISALIITPWAWIPLRALAGFCFAGAAQIMESWLNEGSTTQNRGRVFGTYAMVNLASNTAGQMVLPLGNPAAETFFVLGAVFYALALLPTALYATQQPKPLTEVKLDLPTLWRNSPIAVGGAFLVGSANSCFGTLAAVYGEAIGMSVTVIALFVSTTLFAGAFAQLPVGWLSDRSDRRYVLIGVSILGIVASSFFVSTSPRDLTTVFIAAACFGACLHTMYPLLVSHANDHATEGTFLRTSGGLLLIFGIGSIVGPLIGGGAMTIMGPEGMFMTIATCHVLLTLFALWRVSRRAPVPVEDRTEFQAVPAARNSTPETVALDPRSTHAAEH
ncbi:MAG: MFS transporter [Pseudomonadota bacterium]